MLEVSLHLLSFQSPLPNQHLALWKCKLQLSHFILKLAADGEHLKLKVVLQGILFLAELYPYSMQMAFELTPLLYQLDLPLLYLSFQPVSLLP